MQYTNLVWRDGQPYSEQFDDIYYSSDSLQNCSAVGEFNHVFFKNNDLAQRWKGDAADKSTFVIAELGLGSTLNCLLTIREWLKHCDELNRPDARSPTLHYIAIERYPLSPAAIRKLLSAYDDLKPYSDALLESYPQAVETTHIRRLFNNRVVIHYKFMDVMDALDSTRLGVDAWYLDGFSPAKNPDMWSQSLFEKIANNSHAGTSCSTYTAAGFVRRNMQSAGFVVEKVAGYGKKREMLVARLSAEDGAIKAGHETFKFKDKPWFRSVETSSFSRKKAVIIGAGIAGLSVAQALVKRGWQVTVLDKHDAVANEASGNLASIVYPRLSSNNDVDTEFYLAAYCYALHFLNTLQQGCSTEKFWYDEGLLQRMDRTRLIDILDKYKFNEDFAEMFSLTLSEPELAALNNKNENKNKQTYMHYKNAGVVIPEILCEAIIKNCTEKSSPGELKLVRSDVESVSSDGSSWSCFNGERLISESEVLIVASGFQLNELNLPVTFPVESVRGQMLELKAGAETSCIDKIINDQVYITPAINGLHYLGGSYSRFNEDKLPDEKDSLFLLESAEKIYPQLFTAESCTKTWVGIRSMSKDRAAITGAVPDIDYFNREYGDISDGNMKKFYKPARALQGLYVSAAHGSRGFTHSFLCAEIIASQINSEPAPVSDRVLNYLNPSRFVVNDLKRR